MYILISIVFIVLAAVWFYADPRPFRKRLSDKILYAYLVLLLIIAPQIISFYYFPLPNSSFDSILTFSGILLFSMGFIIDIWARFTMGKYWGPPGQHDDSRQSKLITNGPFAYSRNPIYLGSFLLLIGFSLSLRSAFFFLPIIQMIYFNRKIKIEEKLLLKKFGKEYGEYCQKVNRFI